MNGHLRRLAMVLDRHLRGRDGYGVTRLAEKISESKKTIDNWCAGVCSPSVVSMLCVMDGLRSDEAARAAALWRDLSELAGQESRPLPQIQPAASVVAGALRVQAEAGDLARAMLSGVHPQSPGGVRLVASELAGVVREARELEMATLEVEAAARAAPAEVR